MNTSNCIQGDFKLTGRVKVAPPPYEIILYKDGVKYYLPLRQPQQTHNFTNLEDGTEYTYKVKSINEFGSSPLSPAVSVTTKLLRHKIFYQTYQVMHLIELGWPTRPQNMILILPQTQILITSSNTI